MLLSKLTVLLLLSSVLITEVKGQYHYNFDTYSISAIGYTADFRIDKAREQNRIARQLYPSANIPVWVENYIDFIVLLNSEDEALYKQISKNKKSRLERLGKGNPESPYHLFCQAQVTLQWALIHMKFKDYVTGFREADKAYDLLEKSYRINPDFAPTLAGIGLMRVIVGSIPDNYKWIRNLLGYQGTVEEGLIMLERSLQLSRKDRNLFWLEQEVVFYLSFVYLNLESGKDRALAFMNQYLSEEGISLSGLKPIHAYAFAKVSLLSGMNDQAIFIMKNRRVYPDQTDFHFLTYMLANAYQNRLSDSCHLYFDRFLEYKSVKHFKKACLQRKAWQYLIQGDQEGYKRTMARIPGTGISETDSDKQAESEAQNGKLPVVFLLKSRLLFDGGYYEESLRALSEANHIPTELNPADRAEYHYRLARIYDETGKEEMAIREYITTIDEGKGLPQYFAANSALKTAMIYERRGHLGKARSYYQDCMNMKFSEYRNSILQKAKVGLDRIDKKEKNLRN